MFFSEVPVAKMKSNLARNAYIHLQMSKQGHLGSSSVMCIDVKTPQLCKVTLRNEFVGSLTCTLTTLFTNLPKLRLLNMY